MKRITFFNLFLALMLLSGSCEKESISEPIPTVYDRTGEKDVVSKTIDVETYAIGSDCPEGTYAGSVSHRLTNRVSTFNENTTKAIVLFNCSDLAQNEYLNVFKCFNRGGVIVFVNPDATAYNIFREKVAKAAKTLLVDRYGTIGIDEEQWLKSCQEKLFNCASLTYGMGNAYECLAFCKKDRYLCPSVYPTAGAAQYGLAAEALARWISAELDGEKENHSAVDGEADPDQLPDISSQDYLQSATISCSSPKIFGGKLTAPYADVVDICVKWSLTYSPTSYNRDYYYVDENVTIHTSNLEPVPDAANNKLWHFSNPKHEIAYFDGFEDRIELSMRGENGELLNSEFSAIQYHPHSINETFQPDMTTDPAPYQPVYIAGTFGSVRGSFAGEYKDFKEAFAGSVKQNARGFECTAGEQCDINGIFVNSEARYNYSNYRYISKQPKVNFEQDAIGGEQYTWEIPSNFLSNCSQHNSFYTRTDNPVGIPMLHLTGNWKIRSISQHSEAPYWKSYGSDVFIGQHDDYIDLGRPYRHVEKWTLSCTEYGDLTTTSVPGIQDFEDLYVKEFCPENFGRTNDVAGFNADDTYEANLLFNQFMADFESKSESLAEQGYTGTFVFTFQPEHSEKMLVKSFTINKSLKL